MIDDDRLGVVLESVGAHLDTSPVDATARRRAPRALLVAALVVAVVAGAVLAIAPARRTVGGWFGVGRTEFRVDVDLAVPADRLPTFVVGATPIAPSRVVELAGVRAGVLDDSPLGPPAGWLAAPEGGAVAVWEDHEVSLWLLPIGEMQGMLFTKTVSMADQVRQLPDLGDGGVVVEGAHILATPFRTVPAASAVLWTAGGLSFRLEWTATSAAGPDLVAVAAAIDEVVAVEPSR